MGVGTMRKGFSLLELVTVIAIVGILTMSAIGYFTSLYTNTRIETTLHNAQMLAEQVRRYYDFYGKVPQSQQEFNTFLLNQDFFPQVPKNLLTNVYTSSTGWLWTKTSTFSGVITPEKPANLITAKTLTTTVDVTNLVRENVNYNTTGRTWGGDG